MIKGRATQKGTEAFCERKKVPISSVMKGTGLEISGFGFGSYRINLKESSHSDSLHLALNTGMNVIDTSPNFGDGDSEMVIGSVLESIVGDGGIAREEIVVMTKVGYIEGSMSEDVLTSLDTFKNVGKLSAQRQYCLDPEFIRESLQSSLLRLNLNHVDVFFLNNPEMYLKVSEVLGINAKPGKVSPEEMYEIIGRAFECLETLVDEGLIGCYGVTSGAFTSQLDLSRLMEIAREKRGTSHNFRAIQYPLNVFERSHVTAKVGKCDVAVLI